MNKNHGDSEAVTLMEKNLIETHHTLLTLIFPFGFSGGVHLSRTSLSLISENATPVGASGTKQGRGGIFGTDRKAASQCQQHEPSSGVSITVGTLFSGPHPTIVHADTYTK